MSRLEGLPLAGRAPEEEALENIQEAMGAYLESLQDDRLPIPEDVTVRQVEAAA